MLVAIPDDYHGLVPTLDCFRLLEGHDVRVFREAAPPFETVVSNLRDAEIVVPLLRLPNALCTAHSAWLEKTTYELYFGEAFENAVAFAAGRPEKLVNPEVLKQ